VVFRDFSYLQATVWKRKTDNASKPKGKKKEKNNKGIMVKISIKQQRESRE
jgi:hypothetical protein